MPTGCRSTSALLTEPAAHHNKLTYRLYGEKGTQMYAPDQDPDIRGFDTMMVNRWPDGIADNYSDFVNRILYACQVTLNESDIGQELIDNLLADAIRNNITQEKWQQKKVALLKFCFFFAVRELPRLEQEMAHHLYHELRKENHTNG